MLRVLSGRYPFILLFALPTSLKRFSHFCSRPPCSGFHPRVAFFHFFFFFFFCESSIIHLKIHPEQVNGLSRILAEEKKRQQP